MQLFVVVLECVFHVWSVFLNMHDHTSCNCSVNYLVSCGSPIFDAVCMIILGLQYI